MQHMNAQSSRGLAGPWVRSSSVMWPLMQKVYSLHLLSVLGFFSKQEAIKLQTQFWSPGPQRKEGDSESVKLYLLYYLWPFQCNL